MRAVIFAGLATAVAADHATEFEQFKQKFGKVYKNSKEELEKFKNFIANAEKAEKLKLIDSSATYSALNSPFSDLNEVEFQKQRLGLNVNANDIKTHEIKAEADFESLELENFKNLPTEFDWTTKGAVTGVKDQGQCGSCWAFGTVANLEGNNWLTNKKLVSLSEQELVDCATGGFPMDNNGCNGGLPKMAYEDMIKGNYGLELEADYKYTAQDGKCVKDQSKEKVFVSDWKAVSKKEDDIAAALMKYGPLAIGVNAGYFQTYQKGIMDPWFCNPMGIDHAVTLVGFGEEDGKKFWKVKNSWGESWGEKGYVRMARGNWFPTCGLNRMVTSGLVKKQGEEDAIFV